MDGEALRSAYLAALPAVERRIRRDILLLRLSALACLLYTAALVWAAAAHPAWLPAWTLLQWPLVQKLVIMFGSLFGPWLLLPLLYPFRPAGGLLQRQLEYSGLAARLLAGALVNDALLAGLPQRLQARLPGREPNDFPGQLARLFRLTRRYVLPSFAPSALAVRSSPLLLLIGAVPMIVVFIPLHIAWQLALTVISAFCLPMCIPSLQEQLTLAHYLRRELPQAEAGRALAEAERERSLHLQLNLAERLSSSDPAVYRGIVQVPLVLLLWAPAAGLYWLNGSYLPLGLALLAHPLLWMAFCAWLKRLEEQVAADLARSDIPGQIARGELAVTEEKVAGYGNGYSSFSGWMKHFDADGPDYSFAITVAHVCRHAGRYLYPGRRWPDEVLLVYGVLMLMALGVLGTMLLLRSVGRGSHGEILLVLAPFHFSIALIMLLIAFYAPRSGIAARGLLKLLRERIGT